jgi:toxin-antitoxin system PIN domain toxin
MIAVDTNILVYAHRRDCTFHESAARTLRGLAEGRSAWAIPWPCIHEFFSIATNARIYRPASTTAQAAAQIDAWLESPSLVLLGETPDHWPILGKLVTSGRVTGSLVHDARVAAICLTQGVHELLTADRDFGRFPDLRVRNPLVDLPVDPYPD